MEKDDIIQKIARSIKREPHENPEDFYNAFRAAFGGLNVAERSFLCSVYFANIYTKEEGIAGALYADPDFAKEIRDAVTCS